MSIYLITGGTGSFGSTVIPRLLRDGATEVRVFSRDEKKQHDMRIALNDDRVKFFIGDVRDRASLEAAINGVDFIFHASALKQVPSCEFFPMEAVKTNILGTQNVISLANHFGVKKVVCLSTDKAAYPINAMGISKAMMEKIARSNVYYPGKTKVCVTRYGNVMASRGSVIPLFIDKIRKGEPLTITSLKMTRFLMSLKEAVDLVLFAFEHGEDGDLFIQKSPASTIEDLTKAICQIANIPINTKLIGIRHGEKLYETLATVEEMSVSEDLGSYYRIPVDTRNLNYEKYFDDGSQSDVGVEYNSNNTYRLNVNEIVVKLNEIGISKETFNV